MEQQRNASNQSYGGGSSDYAVIAPYIESPSPFERMGGRQRASGGSSSGKNPFEDFKFDVSSAEGMYFQSSLDYLSNRTATDAALNMLQTNVMQRLSSSSAEEHPSIINGFMQSYIELSNARNQVEAGKTMSKDVYNKNKTLVDSYNSYPYYDQNGFPVKDEKGNQMTYEAMHNQMAMVGMGKERRLENPVVLTPLYELVNNLSADLISSMTTEESVDYSLLYEKGIKTTVANTVLSKESEAKYFKSVELLSNEISVNNDIRRAFNVLTSQYIKSNHKDFSKLTQEEQDKISNAAQSTVVADLIYKSIGSTLTKSTVKTEVVPRSTVYENQFGANIDKFSEFQNMIINHRAGLDPFKQLALSLWKTDEENRGARMSTLFSDQTVIKESGSKTIQKRTIPTTMLEQSDIAELNQYIKQVGINNKSYVNTFFPPRPQEMGVLLRIGNEYVVTDGESIHRNITGIQSIGGANIKWGPKPTAIGVDESEPDFMHYTTDPEVVKFNLAYKKFLSLSNEERKKIYEEYYGEAAPTLTEVPTHLKIALTVISEGSGNALLSLPELLSSNSGLTSLKGGESSKYKSATIALQYAKNNMNNEDIVKQATMNESGGFVPITVYVNDDADILHGYDEDNKYKVKTTSTGEYSMWNWGKVDRRDEIVRTITEGTKENPINYKVVDIEVWMPFDQIATIYSTNDMKIVSGSLVGQGRKKYDDLKKAEALKNAQINQ